MVKPGSVVYVRYRDHLLFRNADATLFQPSIRETVGWVLKENDDAIYLIWDRSVNPQKYEKPNPKESGLVILKTAILELKKIEKSVS